MKLRSWIAAALAALLVMAGIPAMAAVPYRDIYSGAISASIARHDAIAASQIDSAYDQTAYALFDITGDGFNELIVKQVYNKHGQYLWIYSTNGANSYYMGEFECDTICSLYGYRKGILFYSAYKGRYDLGVAEYNGYGFDVSELASGQFDPEGYWPDVSDLTFCYDQSRMLGKLPDFTPIDQWYAGSSGYAGPSASSGMYDLSGYGYRTVRTQGRGALIFQTEPRGSFLKDHKFNDGDQIYVNLTWRKDGYAIAYQNGVYGYVDASYIDWNSGGSGYTTDRWDLANYEYRYVVTKGRGALIFQTEPRGSFLKDFKFYDGDQICVNVNWRQDGYAIAYQNGTYGYVDASYISW